jgi:hypothetical protein
MRRRNRRDRGRGQHAARTARTSLRFMARDLLGIAIQGEAAAAAWREYDLSMLAAALRFPDRSRRTGSCEGHRQGAALHGVSGSAKERITLESMSGADRTIWQMAEQRIGLDIGGTRYPSSMPDYATEAPEWVITRAQLHHQVPPRSLRRARQISVADRDHAAWLQPEGHDAARAPDRREVPAALGHPERRHRRRRRP